MLKRERAKCTYAHTFSGGRSNYIPARPRFPLLCQHAIMSGNPSSAVDVHFGIRQIVFNRIENLPATDMRPAPNSLSSPPHTHTQPTAC